MNKVVEPVATATLKYAIGQRVWWATCQTGVRWETCPDCGGTGRIRVILHDDTQVSVECRNCALGYDKPTGQVRWYGRIAEAKPITISGFEFTGGKASYHAEASGSGSYYRIEEDALFSTEEAAKARAEELAEEANIAEQARVLHKEKDTRTWAWNASYHRGCIKRAQKDIEYHTAKLAVAAIKAKEPSTSSDVRSGS